MNPNWPRLTRTERGFLFSLFFVAATWLSAQQAAAEVAIVNAGGWEIFTDGRMGGFVNYVRGDAYPLDTFEQRPDPVDPTLPPTSVRTRVPFGGGIGRDDAGSIADPNAPDPKPQPQLESMRVRSGFVANIVGLGFRNHLTEYTTVTGYVQFWSDIESIGRRKYVPMPVDVRQGYAKLEGRWGALTIGRQLTLFSRGAAEIDFMYGHGYGVGMVTGIDSGGTSAGHVGTGVLGPGFAAGVVYATPKMAGVQLNVSIWDPVALQGAWDRTKWVRPEAELTYDLAFGNNGKLHLFVNGGYQKVYRFGEPDSTNSSAYGAGYGGRVEVGPVHLGVAGHYGQGLGLYYALETTEAAYDQTPLHRLRKSSGYYGQAQVVLKKFDFNAGVGIARLNPLSEENVIIRARDATGTVVDMPVVLPADGALDASGLRQSLIKYQLGMSAAIVYHVSPALAVDVDYFRAQFRWQLGEKEDVNFVNAGMTMLW